MKKVVVASDNPIKIAVAEAAFAAVFPHEQFTFVGVQTDSHVPDQPFGDETMIGAANRLIEITRRYPDANFWISQEGGLVDDGVTMYNRAWILVADGDGHTGQSSSPSFEIPTEIARMIRTGLELGDAWDIFYGTKDIKRAGSGLARLTEGLIDRKRYYLDAAIIALCQVKNHHLYNV